MALLKFQSCFCVIFAITFTSCGTYSRIVDSWNFKDSPHYNGQHNGRYQHCAVCNSKKFQVGTSNNSKTITLEKKQNINNSIFQTYTQDLKDIQQTNNHSECKNIQDYTISFKSNPVIHTVDHPVLFEDTNITKIQSPKFTNNNTKKISRWGIVGIVVGCLGVLFLLGTIFAFRNAKFM
jgi:hypothetical protein